MQLRQYSLFFLLTTSLVALTGRSANAVSLTGKTTGYESQVPLQGSTLTFHGDAISLLAPPRRNSNFITTLTSLFPRSAGWTFTSAPSDLPGVFNVDYFSPSFPLGTTVGGEPTVDAGAEIQLRYIPPANSTATPNPNKLHWIQQVTNYNDSTPPRKGNPNNFRKCVRLMWDW